MEWTDLLFCLKVREDENYRALPFIFVTADTSQEVKNKLLKQAGRYNYKTF